MERNGSKSAPLLGDPLGQSLLQGLFEDGAPACEGAGFTLTVDKTDFEPGVWHPRWDESHVFRLQLTGGSPGANPYSLHLGRGGQLYSLKTRAGELMPPQNEDHAWVDDCLLLTYLDYGRNFMNTPGNPVVDNLSGFIHQAGMYQSYDRTYMEAHTPHGHFFAPVVAEHWDEAERRYTCVTLGMTPVGPVYTRSDVLMYFSLRDVGGGVIEVQYMTYNYNSSYDPADPAQLTKPGDAYMADITAWGGHRRSVLPKLVMGLPGNPSRYENPFGGDAGMPPFGTGDPRTLWTDPSKTGGWFAAAQNLTDPAAYALSWIVGNRNTSRYTQMFTVGDADAPGLDGRARDFAVMNLNFRGYTPPGTAFRFRFYFCVGELADVAAKSAALGDFCRADECLFTEADTPTVPLAEPDGAPVAYAYAHPVKGSRPLYLLRDRQNDRLLVSCDPYLLMERVVLDRDYQTPKRVGFRAYDGTTDIVKLLGFVMPQSAADPSLPYVRLDSALTDRNYYPQTGIYDADVLARAVPRTNGSHP